jgi:hypothetical protein
MTTKSKQFRIVSLMCAMAACALLGGMSQKAFGQDRDPFMKQGWAQPKTPKAIGPTSGTKDNKSTAVVKPKPLGPVAVTAPAIQDRIAYYKRLRETAVLNNQPIPKVTSVLTLDEMSVTGIFHTPRGYAAMVEAKPIKLSYTIYPGEKFFDGQLVAIEENKLIFKKVTKMSNGKFIAAEENKPLRQYTMEEEVRGTVPTDTTAGGIKKTEDAKAETTTTTGAGTATAEDKPKTTTAGPIVSPLEEMMKHPEGDGKDAKDSAKGKNVKGKKGKAQVSAAGKGAAKETEKKPTKLAENTDQ